MLATVTSRLEQLRIGVEQLSEKIPRSVALPSLPQPPIFNGPLACGDPVAFADQGACSGFARGRWLVGPMVFRVDQPATPRHASPLRGCDDQAAVTASFRHEVLRFPYRRPSSASVVQRACSRAAYRSGAAAQERIITDLDNTLWRGNS